MTDRELDIWKTVFNARASYDPVPDRVAQANSAVLEVRKVLGASRDGHDWYPTQGTAQASTDAT